jgi:hypothetical protein
MDFEYEIVEADQFCRWVRMVRFIDIINAQEHAAQVVQGAAVMILQPNADANVNSKDELRTSIPIRRSSKTTAGRIPACPDICGKVGSAAFP